MSRYQSYLNSAVRVINQYKGDDPFASFIKKYFAEHRKHGSNDRKFITHLCYCYFRIGMAFPEMPVEERMLTGLFLCSARGNPVLEQLNPGWNKQAHITFEEKCSILSNHYSADLRLALQMNLFPFTSELTQGIEQDKFALSHLRQPHLFIRLRPGHEIMVKKKLKNEAIEYSQVSEACLALPNSSKIEKIIELNKEAVVQDYSSQRTAELLFNLKSKISPKESLRTKPKYKVWDCCAASGGKSIMIHDLYPNIDLTVSDIRESILHNLKKRFLEASIKRYQIFKADLTNPHSPLTTRHSPYDLIVCDAPCTGSGTWGRTPEQLLYFEENKISHYASIQKKIVTNILEYLKPGGHLVYITCSVFKKENEEVVDYIRQTLRLELIQVKLLKGYNLNADTMFSALLRKQL